MPKKKHTKQKKYGEEMVELIASGYEWMCPECEAFNEEIEVTETVVCCGCGVEFETYDHHHAVG